MRVCVFFAGVAFFLGNLIRRTLYPVLRAINNEFFNGLEIFFEFLYSQKLAFWGVTRFGQGFVQNPSAQLLIAFRIRRFHTADNTYKIVG